MVVPDCVAGHVAARTGRVVRASFCVVAPSDHDTKSCIATQTLPRVAARVVAPCAVSWCTAALYHSVVPLSFVTIQNIVSRHTSLARPRGRASLARRLCRTRGWPYGSPTVRPSMHPLGPIVPWYPCCVTIQYVVS